jgi:hypothetical protein
MPQKHFEQVGDNYYIRSGHNGTLMPLSAYNEMARRSYEDRQSYEHKRNVFGVLTAASLVPAICMGGIAGTILATGFLTKDPSSVALGINCLPCVLIPGGAAAFSYLSFRRTRLW